MGRLTEKSRPGCKSKSVLFYEKCNHYYIETGNWKINVIMILWKQRKNFWKRSKQNILFQLKIVTFWKKNLKSWSEGKAVKLKQYNGAKGRANNIPCHSIRSILGKSLKRQYQCNNHFKVINDMFQAVRGEQNCKDAIVFSFVTSTVKGNK